MVKALHSALTLFFRFKQIFLPLSFFCFVSRFLYLFCPLAIYTSNIPLLQKTLLLALSNCLEVASSNSTNNVLDVVQDADPNDFWNIRLPIATFLPFLVLAKLSNNFFFVFSFCMI